MPTGELENELRHLLARAAADVPDPEQAGQRLLQPDYRPGGGHRRLAAGITATTVAAAGTALVLGLTGVIGTAPNRGTIRTAAFTLVSNTNGTASLTINPKVLFEPGTLESDLAQYGIPATVTSGSFCSSDPAPAGFSQVVTFQPSPAERDEVPQPVKDPTITINPAAMPAGTELSFGNFQGPAGRQETALALIDTSANGCTSTAPATPPSGGALLVYRANAGI